ncbi:2-keto-4-pentenoate hydratase/2-oxohepta-3-ene-1,7-dioic acid hydratase (catechol pathway) [Actinopolyspora saharensis]|uniref:2-keto-4-pentenoate hydratase/2-oxohepta-3-ene-1,7-dioic acid hydratase (Catechol pathway) n=1 Tax=Actinopolyspora saharensis TaxID=995062 RepID=A0A1H1E3D9_9ACTN|nr:2-keto-4-pentenoate hydratase/2-oxohepta-3-ene-1,7-dioic acid hydratase (catechol pathway) [Actinopolyspora saharensis]
MRIERLSRHGRVHTVLSQRGRKHVVAGEPVDNAAVLRRPDDVPVVEEFSGERLAPVRPATLFGMARNTGEENRALPPAAFLKAPATVTDPGADVPLPEGIGRVDAEAELAVVLGAPLRNGSGSEVLEHVLGYTVGIDVTARDAQREDPLWTTAKSRSGFSPLGPWIETEPDPAHARISLLRNGSPVAEGSTGELARGVVEVLEFLSELVELRPGDVVLTGAPGTYAPVAAGDTVTALISGIGELTVGVTSRAAHTRVERNRTGGGQH